MTPNLALALTLLGCGGGVGAGETADPLGPAWVDLGAGESAYSPLEDGGGVEIVMGPQGGYMIALALRAGGVVGGDAADPTRPENPRVTYQAHLEGSGATLGSITVINGLTAVDEQTFELVGTWLIFDSSLDTAEYFDQMIDVDVFLIDSDGRETGAGAAVTALAPAAR